MSFTFRAGVFTAALIGMTLSAVAFAADLLHQVGNGYRAQAAQATGGGQAVLLASAEGVYRRAVQFAPWEPSHVYMVGRVHESRAARFSPLSLEAQASWQAAAEFYGQAVRRHPANARFHAALAWAHVHAGDVAEGRRSIRTALRLAPDYPDVRFTVARWYLMQWEVLSAEDRVLVVNLVDRGAKELPELYVETVWQLVRDPKTVRNILPNVPGVRRLSLTKLTEHGLFAERWAEQAAHPALKVQPPPKGFLVLAHDRLSGRQEPLPESASAGPWAGMVTGWLSGGLVAKTEVDLPAGEVVLYLRMLGEPAGGIWPTVSVALGGQGLPLPAIAGPGVHTSYFLLATPGGRMPLQAVLTNGAVILEHGQFIERRVQLGPVRVLTTASVAGPSGSPSAHRGKRDE